MFRFFAIDGFELFIYGKTVIQERILLIKVKRVERDIPLDLTVRRV